NCEKSRTLHETMPLAAAAPTDQREQTEDRGTDSENDRDLLEALARDGKSHFFASALGVGAPDGAGPLPVDLAFFFSFRVDHHQSPIKRTSGTPSSSI